MWHISPFMIPITAIIMSGLWPLLRAYAKKIERSSQTTAIPMEVTSRLERMEQSLDAVAVEIERISEGQRFTTKLLSENPRGGDQRIAAKSASDSVQQG